MDLIKKYFVPVVATHGNAIYVTTSNRTVVAPPDYPKTRQANLRNGLQAFNHLPQEQRKPRTVERRADDGWNVALPPDYLVLRVLMRSLVKDRRGDFQRQQVQSRYHSGPQRDFLWFTPAEARSLMPSAPRTGDKFPLPEALAIRLYRFYLNDRTLGIMGDFYDKEECRAAELVLTVQEVSAQKVTMRFDGHVRLSDHADTAKALRKSEYKFEGYASYHPGTQRFLQFDVVGVGDHYDKRPITKVERLKHYFDSTGHTYIGERLELATPDSLGYGTPPLPIRNGDRTALVNYFGPELDAPVLDYFRLKR